MDGAVYAVERPIPLAQLCASLVRDYDQDVRFQSAVLVSSATNLGKSRSQNTGCLRQARSVSLLVLPSQCCVLQKLISALSTHHAILSVVATSPMLLILRRCYSIVDVIGVERLDGSEVKS